MKVIVCSLGDANFNIITGVLQEDTLAPFFFFFFFFFVYTLPRLHTLNVNRSNKRKWLHTKKKSQETDKTMTDAHYADNQVLLANTSAPAESLLHSLELAVVGIGLHMNTEKNIHVLNKKEPL